MKKARLLIFLVLAAFLYGSMDQYFAGDRLFPRVSGQAAVIMDEQTGELVFKKNENESVFPASTTKLLTALVVLDHQLPSDTITIGREVNFQSEGEARAGLFIGQTLSVEDLLAAMLLQSGNDAARSLAISTARKVSGNELGEGEALVAFSRMMNKKAREAGAENSNFINPHGLHHPEHYTTAYDIALIAKAASQNETIRRIVELQSYSTKTHTYMNRNLLLKPESHYFYENATGMKTGFTNEAGYCLVTSAKKDGRQLIAVVMDSGEETVWRDSVTLLKYGFGDGKRGQKVASPPPH